MNMRGFEAFCARHSGYGPSEIDQRVRPLRELRLVPFGPRGPAAPHLEAMHGAFAVLSMVARRASDVKEVVQRAMKLQSVARDGWRPLDHDVGLVAMIALALTDRNVVDRIEVFCDGSLAWVTLFLDGERRKVLFTDDEKIRDYVTAYPETYDATGAHYMGHRFVMTGALADALALELLGDDDAEQRKAG